ncbi:hypothetical protein NQ318_007030 [Aromia moschata]|uniref:Uncharacterized protein n=1 Tax=Aromia moschata TaxID=1265417 RepID=A0AAV8Y365_9CUCU|nr:hypothetical protein NQ318_007030 [Aromia moschata]
MTRLRRLTREHDQLKRLCAKLRDDLAVTRAELEEQDRLIAEKGLVIVGEEVPPDEDGTVHPPKKALVSAENAERSAGEFAKEKSELQDQISHLKLELEKEERSKRRKPSSTGVLSTARPQITTQTTSKGKQANNWRTTSSGRRRPEAGRGNAAGSAVAWLESQVIRYKTAAEVSEQSEEALKAEKRKLQREESDSLTDLSTDARDALSRAEELENLQHPPT